MTLVNAAPSRPVLARTREFPPESVIFGCTGTMQALWHKLEKVVGTNIPVLIQGESGTGKEVLAQFIHHRSPWSSGPLMKVSCAAIPGTLLESELFGYQKGAFSGAYTSKPGRVEQAHHGTLFLDEIAELDPSLQAKLLHLLQDGQFCRIGDSEEKRVEARIICATNRHLEQEIETGRFRADLFYRINVVTIYAPRLRERREDIPILADYFLSCFNRRFERTAPSFPAEILQLLQQREWRGNIRELENWVARYVLLGSEEALNGDLLERHGSAASSVGIEVGQDGSIPLKSISKQFVWERERAVILKVLQANHWNRRKTAEMLHISYRALLYKIRQAGLLPKKSRGRAGTLQESASSGE